MLRRLSITHGGFKDGNSFKVNPTLFQASKTAFVAQAEIIALRTGRAVTRDASGFVTPAITVGQKVQGLISFGFIDRLETREEANVVMTQTGEGLTVLTGRFGTTVDETMFTSVTGMVAGSLIYVAPAAGGKMTLSSVGAVEQIGWVSSVSTGAIAIEINI